MENKLFFSKVRDVKSPVRGTKVASGVDLFMPVFNEQFIDDFIKKNPMISDINPGCHNWILFDKKIFIAPGAKVLIPSGIKFRGTVGVSLNVCNKSGIGSKKGLDRLAEIIDADYQGETHISLTNTTPYIVEISENEKIVQVLQIPVLYDMPEELPEAKLFEDIESDRGADGFGSTDNK